MTLKALRIKWLQVVQYQGHHQPSRIFVCCDFKPHHGRCAADYFHYHLMCTFLFHLIASSVQNKNIAENPTSPFINVLSTSGAQKLKCVTANMKLFLMKYDVMCFLNTLMVSGQAIVTDALFIYTEGCQVPGCPLAIIAPDK